MIGECGAAGPVLSNQLDGGEMSDEEETDTEEKIELVQELLFEVKCFIHGKDHITFHPRLLNLGHGKAYVEIGKATCLKCGTSHWISADTYITKFERVPMRQWQQVVLDDMRKELGPAMVPPTKEEVIHEPEPEPEPGSEPTPQGAPAPAGPAVPFVRRPLGG